MTSHPPTNLRPRARTMLLLVLSCFILPAALAQTAFTYQGRLTTGGQPAQGSHDVEFRLFDALTDGNQVGSTLTENDLNITDGVFSAVLDFGDGPFNSAPRWLQIDVRQAGGGAFTTLLPRQRVGASPFAIETLFVSPGAVDSAALQDGAVTESKLAEESVTLGKLATGSVTSGAILNNQVSSVDIANGTIQRADLQDDLIGSTQIEDGTVASNDIRDGTITPADIAGGLYSEKTQLYEVRSTTIAVASFPRTRSASCLDLNDLPIWGGCDATTSGTGLVFNRQFENWNSESAAAELTCTGNNLDPANPASYEAVLWCVSVP